MEERRRTWWNEGPMGAGFLSAISHLPHKQIAIFNAIVSQSFLIHVCRRMMPRLASGSLLPDSRKYILRVWPDTRRKRGGGRGGASLRLRLPFRHSTRGKQCSSMASLYRKCRGSVLLAGGRADTQSTLRYRPGPISRFRDRERDSDPDPDRFRIPPPLPSDALKFYSTD